MIYWFELITDSLDYDKYLVRASVKVFFYPFLQQNGENVWSTHGYEHVQMAASCILEMVYN